MIRLVNKRGSIHIKTDDVAILLKPITDNTTEFSFLDRNGDSDNYTVVEFESISDEQIVEIIRGLETYLNLKNLNNKQQAISD